MVAAEHMTIRHRGRRLSYHAARRIAGKVTAGEETGRPRQREFEPGDFYRAFTLSGEVDPAEIEATFSAGVLELRVPHRRPVEGRRIDVRVE